MTSKPKPVRIVRIDTLRAGPGGTARMSVIKARNGWILWRGPVFVFTEAALEAARGEAARQGWIVEG